jgi:uncharacterized protein YpmS
MAKKIYRIASWTFLILTVVSIVLMLRKPSAPPVVSSPEAAKSFDEKIAQVEEPSPQSAPQEVHITEAELNSKLQESMAGAGTTPGPAALEAASIHLEGDRMIGTFTVKVSGKDLYLTLGGTLGAVNGQVQFTPTEVKLGSLPVPVSAVESTLRQKLDSPEMRDHMKLPDSIKDIRIENGELVLVPK